MVRSLFLAVALSSLACVHEGALAAEPQESEQESGQDAPGSRWIESESAHFVLRSDLTAEESRAALLGLERVRLGLITGSWHAQTSSPVKTHVILLGEDELAPYVRRGVSGFASSDPFESPLLVASAAGRIDDLTVLKHEMAHHIDNAFLLRQPRWLSEGLASFLETMSLKRDGSAVTVGELNPTRFHHLQEHPRIRLQWVMQAGAEIYSTRQTDVEDFYAQSWFFVHYLMNHRHAQLQDFVDRLALAEEPEPAWEKSFGKVTIAQLQRELASYLSSPGYQLQTYKLPKLATPVATRELSLSDELAERALLRSISFGKANKDTASLAALEADKAVEADPTGVLASGIWSATGKRPRESLIDRARKVVTAHPNDSRSYDLLGLALGPKAAPQEIEALSRASQLDAQDGRALANLALGYLTLNREADALVAARQAVAIAPGNSSYLDSLALALAANGDCKNAYEIEKRAIDVLPDEAAAPLTEYFEQRLHDFTKVCAARRAGVKMRFVPEDDATPAKKPSTSSQK